MLAWSATGMAKIKVDRYFVDSQNNTGYYIDVNSITMVGEQELQVDLYLVKSREGYMYVYRTNFDLTQQSYQYVHTKIYRYDSKSLIAENNRQLPPLTYKNSPILLDVVAFAQEWKRTHISKTQYGETWE